MGNVIVAGVQAADEASHGSVVRYIVLAGIHQADLIVDVEAELVALFDADHVAVLVLHCGIDKIDHLLGLAGAFDPHDHSNHLDHSLQCPPERSPACVTMLPFPQWDCNRFAQIHGKFMRNLPMSQPLLQLGPQRLVSRLAQKSKHVLLVAFYAWLVKWINS